MPAMLAFSAGRDAFYGHDAGAHASAGERDWLRD